MTDDNDDLKPRAESVGADRAEMFHKWKVATVAQLEADRPAAREAAAAAAIAAQYTIPDELWFRITRTACREGEPERYYGECIAGLPDSTMMLDARGADVDEVLFEARWGYVQCLLKARTCKTAEEARERAAKALLTVADVVR